MIGFLFGRYRVRTVRDRAARKLSRAQTALVHEQTRQLRARRAAVTGPRSSQVPWRQICYGLGVLLWFCWPLAIGQHSQGQASTAGWIALIIWLPFAALGAMLFWRERQRRQQRP